MLRMSGSNWESVSLLWSISLKVNSLLKTNCTLLIKTALCFSFFDGLLSEVLPLLSEII